MTKVTNNYTDAVSTQISVTIKVSDTRSITITRRVLNENLDSEIEALAKITRDYEKKGGIKNE
jgi:hypothetical protein